MLTIKNSSKLTKKISALTMAALIVMEQFAYFPQVSVSADKTASDSGAVNFPSAISGNEESAILSHNDQLVDNGNGTYTFTSELMSSYSYFDESKGRLYSQDGSYTLDKAGTYLIELWGGDGGDGSSFFPLSFKAGAGGKGGFVYGLLDVSEEQAAKKNKLYYEIGSRGLSETRSITGGGTGGIGGGAGDIAVFSVGAGGGYSAVYLMGKDDEISDEIRNNPDKVLMIAGGGGGGGAGAALHTLPGLFGGDGKANGGEGGTFESSISDTPNIGAFVPTNDNVGTYYAGKNGSTSGTKGAYVGKGGTDIPGEIVTSFIGFLEASSYPNDWQKTYHPELDRGVGGASNFRGGGGGAGFAGGSGGMQNEPLDARNVGGGGGGSSYVGRIANFRPKVKGDANYFVERDGNTNSDTGGAVVIRYLSGSDEGTDYSYLNSISVSGEISPYFDIVSTNCSHSGNSFTANGSVAPVSTGLAKGQEKDKLTFSITIKPKAGFFGGNNVPIFNEDTATLNVTGGAKATTITLDDDVKYVNVPYNISIKTKNSTVHKDDVITKQTLYADGYSEIAYNANDPMQAYISGISYEISEPGASGYTASNNFSYTITENDVNKTLSSDIKVTLEERAGITPAKVGSTGTNVFHKKAALRCVNSSPYSVDGLGFDVDKKLSYNETDGTYDLTTDMSYNVDVEKECYVYDPIEPYINNDYLYITDTQRTAGYNSSAVSPVIPSKASDGLKCSPGYYYFEVYGADGGTGGNHNNITFGVRAYGSEGGKGSYVSGYILVPEETIFKIVLGRAGYNGPSGRVAKNTYYSGGGGEYSAIKYLDTDTEVLIAGGGGGGGSPTGYTGEVDAANPGHDAGDPGTDGVRNNTTYNPQNIYCGENGQWMTDYTSNDYTPYVAKGGQNYRCQDILTAEQVPDIFIKPDTTSANGLTEATLDAKRSTVNGIKAGAVRISKLGVKGGYVCGNKSVFNITDMSNAYPTLDSVFQAEMTDNLGSITITESLSDYFTIESSTDGTINSSSNTVTFTDSLSVVNTDIIDSDEKVKPPIEGFENLNYKTTKHTYIYAVQNSTSTHTVKLKPINGFLGGNDVPLLESAALSHSGNTASESDDIRAIPPLDYTDFANVALAGETLEDTVLTKPVFVDYNTPLTEAMLSANVAGYPYGTDKGLCDDYADYSAVAYDEKVGQNITEDTDCFVTAELKATSAAEKANVIGAVDKVSRNFKVPVYVRYPIETDLTHLTSNAAEEFPTAVDDTELVFEITADSGYDLPAEDDVEITNTDLTDPNAVPTAMENTVVEKIDDKITVRIPRSSITGKVTVKASGVDAKHSVKYYYQMYDHVGKAISLEEAVDSKTFANGEVITGITYPALPDKYPNGYDGYFWDWSIETDTNGDHIMGQEDVIIVGTYKPITYGINVRYYTTDENQNTVPLGEYTSPFDRTKYENGTYHIALTKGTEYYVASPEFEGYVTDTPYVSGKVDDAFINDLTETRLDDNGKEHLVKVVDVRYTKVSEDTELIVNFVKCDVRGAPTGEDSKPAITHVSGYNYSLISGEIATAISGYDKVKITKVASDASETEVENITEAGTYNVYYREIPQTVTIRLFKNSGDTEPAATRKAVIGREYSYDPDNDDYIPLPTVVDSTHEYRHTGWKTESGDIIEDDTIVSGSAGDVIKLCAVWESTDITITVRYLFAMNVSDVEKRGTAAAAQIAETMTYGMSYTFNAAEIPNYTAEPQRITGVALADKTETFYYIDAENPNKSITIKANIYSIYYKDSDSGKAADGAPLLKGGTFALYAQDGTLIGTKQNTSGVVSWNNTEFDIRQDMTYTIKCTAPPIGYGAGEAVVTVGTSDTDIVIDDIEIFLDVTPFELPFAGSTPMTGYTVFGLSTMVLAVFLLFVHMRSKTEEEKIKKIRRV
ncbi:MAG: hypothetical protein E7494_10520 [Ruminococcus albus]|jgi:hypothetical protein|nr:hypothetical protein [Ruminococcus albus]